MGKGFMMAGVFVVAMLLVCPAMAFFESGTIMVPGYLGDPGLVVSSGQNVGAAQISISTISFCDTQFLDELPCWVMDTTVLDSGDTFFTSEGVD